MAVIAMAPEMGTRGTEVALGVAERLGLEIIHHELVEHDIAAWTGMPESQVHWSPGRRGLDVGAVAAR